MDSLRQLFDHELRDIYYAEHALVKALGEMEGESTNPNVQRAFAMHKTQTENHIDRLDQVFAALGEDAEEEVCPGIEGLIKEKKMFAKEKPTSGLLDLYNLGAGAKSERYEITAYEGLIDMANQLNITQVSVLLEANLREEEQALSTVKNLSKTALMSTAPGMAAKL